MFPPAPFPTVKSCPLVFEPAVKLPPETVRREEVALPVRLPTLTFPETVRVFPEPRVMVLAVVELVVTARLATVALALVRSRAPVERVVFPMVRAEEPLPRVPPAARTRVPALMAVFPA